MKIDKEYPATHSMSTAWFCADMEGNVAIIDIEDDGPVPVGTGGYNDGTHIWETWEDVMPSHTEERIYDLPLTDEQIVPMLLPIGDEKDVWTREYGRYINKQWADLIAKIDLGKLDILRKVLSHKDENNLYLSPNPICISRSQGLFFMDLGNDKEAVDTLLQEEVVLELYKAPRIWPAYNDDGNLLDGIKHFPFFLYHQDYTPGFLPAERMTMPQFPLKVTQLSVELQKNIKTLPLRFSENKYILLAEHIPVYGAYTAQYKYDGKIWDMLAKDDKEVVYYNTESHTIIDDMTMKSLIEKGEARELDVWHRIEETTDNAMSQYENR